MINIFLPGVDWKLYFHGRVFYERNCYEGELCNVWCNKSFSLKCVDAFIPSLLWLFHHKVALFSYFLLTLKGIFICFYCLLSVTRFAFIENELVNATDTFTAAGIFLGFIISIISHHTFAIFYTMYSRVPHSFTLILFLLRGCQNGCVRGWWRWSSYFQYGGWCVFYCTEGCQVRKHSLQILSWKYQSILWQNTVKVESSCTGLWFDF